MAYYLLSILLFGQSTSAQIELSTGGGLHKGDPAATAGVAFDASSEQISFGLSAPFTTTWNQDQVRFVKREWDSPTDYAHAIRYLTWRGRAKFMKIGLRIGETHSTTLGLGSIALGTNYLLFFDSPHTGGQFGLEHENFKAFFFVDDFVKPQSGGGALSAHFDNGIFAGGSFFADPSMPLTMADPLGDILVDQELGLRTPDRTRSLFALSLYGGYLFTSGISLAGEALTLDPEDSKSYGGLAHLTGKYVSRRWRLKGGLHGGFGGERFLPFMASPFYLLQREAALEGSPETLQEFLQGASSLSYGFAAEANAKLSLSQSTSLSFGGSFIRNRLGDTATLTTSLIILRRLTLAAYGAITGSDRSVFSLEGRIALPKGWFIWGRGKRLFAISPGTDYYTSTLQVLAGVGYRETPEE